MLQALLASGALFSGIKAEISERAERYAFMAAMGLAALLFVLVGLGALAVAASLALAPQLGMPGAVAAVGGGALIIAAILILIGTSRKTARAATRDAPASSGADTPFAGLADAAGQAPVPWLVGALALGILLGRKS